MKKSLAFTYGLIAYIVFLVAFLYAIGFVGNVFVPKTIDGDGGTVSLSSFVIDAILLGLFAVQHSVMARPQFKKWITQYIHPAVERSTFVLISSLLLILLFWQWRSMDGVIWESSGAGAVILQSLYFVGWGIVLLATFMINHFDLFGLKQVVDNLKNKQALDADFKINWFYRIVRHPLMLGFLIAFWSAPVMTAGHLLFSVATTAYILIAVKFFEEKDLIKEHGSKYLEYRKKVPMLIPFTK
ncbi:MAG: isoprenylcysteine carboxylmethyltransferase family protein [Williamsia sp.]|nr:isoprenylcysteine carboxylmethyltransferase family protein [Williamsia sp.]